jgi:penicillin amidase
MKLFKAISSLAITLTMLYLCQTKFGDIPPLGNFLNPISGFWQNAEQKEPIKAIQTLDMDGLYDYVAINYDDHMIPHIFAKNDHDLYFAQGYVTAKDRLWQMDMQTRSASGRLAEVIGASALDHDKYERRMGMVYGAEKTLGELMKNQYTKEAILSYTEGVNSYISQLSIRDYPLEFKLLDYKPEYWKPLNCALLMKLMSETLAGGSDEFAMTNDLDRFGLKAVEDLFPDHSMHQEPVIPKGTKWNFLRLSIPKTPAIHSPNFIDSVKPRKRIPGIGSNNWAVSGNKTLSGYPILANDPHLTLSFPSIWYQLQMSSPSVNVNGVSIPGSPCIIIGYNKDISWGVTNVGADILDWYQLKFKDKSKNEYWYNNKWTKVSRRIERIIIRGQKTQFDTVIYTHYGPVVYETNQIKTTENVPVGSALRWIAHDSSRELMTFYYLNRAKNYSDYREALSFYSAPAQNFVFASKQKDIALTVAGRFPLKSPGQGKFILDGSDSTNNWHGWIPFQQNPAIKNPDRGFVSSANQQSTDSNYPYYINWEFDTWYRAKRINDRLSTLHKITIDSMKRLQTDNYSVLAQDVLPTMLKYLDSSVLSGIRYKAYNIIKHWNKEYNYNSIGASIFNEWWLRFYSKTWSDKFIVEGLYLKPPSYDRTEQLLLKESNSNWFYNSKTKKKENSKSITISAFNEVVTEMEKKYGPISSNWEWGNIKYTYINHLASLSGFGSGVFAAGGTEGVINALQNDQGPSWRMVVEMGPRTKAYGILPGGESGNAGSYYYDDMLQNWKEGKLNELLFLESEKDNSPSIKSRVIFIPKMRN